MTETPYRTALIVGVGGGLSASVARTFAKAGMKIALAARRAADLAALAKEVGGEAFACDATKRGDVVRLFGEVERAYGAPDVVVYNASYRTRGAFIELDPAEVEKTLAVSVFGGFLVAQEAAKPDTTEPRPSQPGKQDNQSESNQKALHIHRIYVHEMGRQAVAIKKPSKSRRLTPAPLDRSYPFPDIRQPEPRSP